MANVKLISRRIKSAKNISQITKAMEMVAASKMKRAQEAAVSGKPYAAKIAEAVTELARRTEKTSHPESSNTDSPSCEHHHTAQAATWWAPRPGRLSGDR